MRFSRAVSLVASSLPIAIKRFHLEFCNLRANPSIPAKLFIFVPFCPPLGVILSTSVLPSAFLPPSSFLPNSPPPSYDAPLVHCVGILSRHRLSEPPHPSSPALSPVYTSRLFPRVLLMGSRRFGICGKRRKHNHYICCKAT